MPSESSPASSPVPLRLELALLSEPEISTRSWEFVDNYIQSLGDGKDELESSFRKGQRQGLFSITPSP